MLKTQVQRWKQHFAKAGGYHDQMRIDQDNVESGDRLIQMRMRMNAPLGSLGNWEVLQASHDTRDQHGGDCLRQSQAITALDAMHGKSSLLSGLISCTSSDQGV